MKRMLSESAHYESSQPTTKKTYYGPKTYRKKTQAKSSVPYSLLSKIVKKELKKATETKHVHVAGVESTINTISSGSGLNFISQPYPTVGAGPTERVGNKISPVGMSWKGVYYNAHAYPIIVRRLIVQVEDGEQSNSNILLNLFEGDGNNIDTSATGSMHDLVRKVNREGYKVLKDDLIDMGINNGGKSMEVSKVYVKLTGTQTYREAASTHAVNDRIVVIHIAREGDGDESTGSTVEMTSQMDLYYKDN